MGNAIPVDVFKKELLDLLAETFEQTQGIFLDRNTSLFETLDTVSAEDASRPVSPSGATIAGHVNHVTYYLHVLTRCIQRNPDAPVDWAQSWKRRVVDETIWRETTEHLRTAYRETIHAVKTLHIWEGEDDIGASLAILAHTASHLGTIRQALHLLR